MQYALGVLITCTLLHASILNCNYTHTYIHTYIRSSCIKHAGAYVCSKDECLCLCANIFSYIVHTTNIDKMVQFTMIEYHVKRNSRFGMVLILFSLLDSAIVASFIYVESLLVEVKHSMTASSIDIFTLKFCFTTINCEHFCLQERITLLIHLYKEASPSSCKFCIYWKHLGNSLSGSATIKPLYWHGLSLIPAWVSNYTPRKVWDKITYPFPNLNGETVEVGEWLIKWPKLNCKGELCVFTENIYCAIYDRAIPPATEIFSL